MSHPSLSESSSESGSSGRAAIAEEEEVEVDDSSAPNEDSSSGDGPSNSRQRRDSGDSWSSGIPEGPEADEEDMETLYMNNPRDDAGIPTPVVRPVRAVIGPRSRPRDIPEVRPPMEVPSITGRPYVPAPKKPKVIRPQTSKESCKLIVDYLISEGYKDVAETLCQEAGIDIPVAELRHLDGRVAIRDAIMNGRMEDAIKMVKALCPGLMESSPDVRFNLHQQLMIELIRVSSIDEVLKYAEKHISQDDKLLPDQLDRLERTFALLAFDDPNESPFSNLLSPEHRQQISTEINGAILRYQNRPAVPRLEALMRMIIWAEMQLYEKEHGRAPPSLDAAKLSSMMFGKSNLIVQQPPDLGTSI